MPDCRLCHGTRLELAADFGNMPIAHRMPASADGPEDLFPFQLLVCSDCGLLQIAQPIPPELLYADFNYNFSSWKHEPHQPDELALIARIAAPRSVLEVGCNDGRFLLALQNQGADRLLGIEPNPCPAAIARDRGFTVVETLLTAETAATIAAEHGTFDLVVARQVIEHIPDLDSFVAALHRLTSPDGFLFLDTPDITAALRTGDCTTLWEEHPVYFTPTTLTYLLERQGFEIVESRHYDFSGGTIALLARRRNQPAQQPALPASAEMLSLAASFGARVEAYGRRLTTALARARAMGAEIVLYGVGVRGCTGVNALRLGPAIDYAIDDQTERQGRFMPGARLEVRSPDSLNRGSGPVVCLLAVNNENEDKVCARLQALVRRPITFVSLCSPRDIEQGLAGLEVFQGQNDG